MLIVGEKHARFDLRNGGEGSEACSDGEGKFCSGRGALTRDEIAILHDRSTDDFSPLQFAFKTRVASGFYALEQTALSQDDGSGADGRDEGAFFFVYQEEFAKSVMLEQIAGTRHTAWENESVAFGEESLAKYSFGHDGDAVCAANEARACDGNKLYFEVATAENIDSGECFDFFEAFSKKDVEHMSVK